MSTVLFLDVDGVLNNIGVFRDKRFGPIPLDHECIRRLHDVVRATGCKIVLSSAWRGAPDLERKLAGDMVWKVFRTLGTKRTNPRHKDGSTKRLWTKRGEEIAEWLSRHPEVERYAIVDDDSDMLPEQMPFFVQTSAETGGLKKRHANRLIKLLLAAPLPALRIDGER